MGEVIYFLISLLYGTEINFEGCGVVNPCTGKVKNKLWVESDGKIKLEMYLDKREYKVGEVKIENLKIMVKNVSDDVIYILRNIDPNSYSFTPIVVSLRDENGEILIPERANYYDYYVFLSSVERRSLIPSNLIKPGSFDDIDKIIPLEPNAFIGSEIPEIKYYIWKAGRYWLYFAYKDPDFRKFFVKKVAEELIYDKSYEYKMMRLKQIYDKIWSGCVVSKPIEIIVKE